MRSEILAQTCLDRDDGLSYFHPFLFLERLVATLGARAFSKQGHTKQRSAVLPGTEFWAARLGLRVRYPLSVLPFQVFSRGRSGIRLSHSSTLATRNYEHREHHFHLVPLSPDRCRNTHGTLYQVRLQPSWNRFGFAVSGVRQSQLIATGCWSPPIFCRIETSSGCRTCRSMRHRGRRVAP